MHAAFNSTRETGRSWLGMHSMPYGTSPLRGKVSHWFSGRSASRQPSAVAGNEEPNKTVWWTAEGRDPLAVLRIFVARNVGCDGEGRRSRATLRPDWAIENSPAFQRWVRWPFTALQAPCGAAEFMEPAAQHSAAPGGAWRMKKGGPPPSVETLGYFLRPPPGPNLTRGTKKKKTSNAQDEISRGRQSRSAAPVDAASPSPVGHAMPDVLNDFAEKAAESTR